MFTVLIVLLWFIASVDPFSYFLSEHSTNRVKLCRKNCVKISWANTGCILR